MCGSCGCGDPEIVVVDLHERILAGNERTARHNRTHFAAEGVFAVNLMGSPGSGKTALLEAASAAFGRQRRLGAIAGDLETERDAERLRAAGVRAAAITTGSACHLDAAMVHRALHDFPCKDIDYLFIENVGNLVCPAIYDLGQAVNVVTLSVTEGEDKPLKYPVMFRNADLVLLTKVDLLPHLEVDLVALEEALARVRPEPRVLRVSARTGEGLQDLWSWLEDGRAAGSRAPSLRLEARGASHPGSPGLSRMLP
jgi:hydrogenase nickel incorporation protein HypB